MRIRPRPGLAAALVASARCSTYDRQARAVGRAPVVRGKHLGQARAELVDLARRKGERGRTGVDGAVRHGLRQRLGVALQQVALRDEAREVHAVGRRERKQRGERVGRIGLGGLPVRPVARACGAGRAARTRRPRCRRPPCAVRTGRAG